MSKKNYEIDWEWQWKTHSPGFQNGWGWIDLQQFGYSIENLTFQKPLKMKPGPGFGDLSHPTTRLMIAMMKDKMANAYVVDVGCGSGVLALCAAALGAQCVAGIDIDSQALLHAQENVLCNDLQEKIQLFSPSDFRRLSCSEREGVILMNMIASEQKGAWEALPMLHSLAGDLITSGVLLEQRSAYHHLCKARGWRFCSECEEAGWLAMHWKHN